MKKILATLSVALCFAAQAQEIEESKIDRATKQYTITTKITTLFKGNLEDATAMQIGFYSLGNVMYIALTGTSHYRLTLKEKIVFAFQNDSTATINFANPQSADYASPLYSMDFSFIAPSSDIKLFSHSLLKSVQVYTTSDPLNRDVNKKNADEIMDIANAFLSEYANKVSK